MSASCSEELEEDSANESFDINASSTESSDEDTESVDGDELIDPQNDTGANMVAAKILEKYQTRQGKQLYIRFSKKLPEDEKEFEKKVKSLSPLIKKAHKPRQKYARFCLVDFDSREDRDSALKYIRNAVKQDVSYKGIHASIPRTENAEFIKDLVEKKVKSIENRKTKARLKRASKLALRDKNFTSSIVIMNLPKSASVGEVRKLFPKAVDIQIKAGKGKMYGANVAAITLSSTLEARAAVKQKIIMGGTELNIRFDIQKLKRKKKPKSNKNQSGVKISDKQNYNSPSVA